MVDVKTLKPLLVLNGFWMLNTETINIVEWFPYLGLRFY
jgi:hypothetical protein